MEVKDDTRKIVTTTTRLVINDEITIMEHNRYIAKNKREQVLFIRGQNFQKLNIEYDKKNGEIYIIPERK